MSEVAVTQEGSLLEITFDRPAKKNALTFAMYRTLIEALAKAETDPSVRVVLFSGKGDNFTAGNDIGDFLSGAMASLEDVPPAKFVETLAVFKKPIVAAVHGATIGVGATMLLHCELAYASETTRLQMPFVSLALVPEAGSSLLLPLRVGHAVASEMLLLGAVIDANRARELGLVNAVLPAGELLAHARAKAKELADKPPGSVRTTKALLRGDTAPLLARIREENVHFAACIASPEAQEAFAAFMERRPADFSKF